VGRRQRGCGGAVAVALEVGVVADADLDEEVAVARAAVARRALAVHPEGLTVADAGGDFDGQRRLVADGTLAAAGRARLVVQRAFALAAAAGLGLLDAAHRRLLDARLLALAVTLRAGPGVGVRRVAAAVAVGTGLRPSDGQLLFDAVVGVLEVDGQRRSQILALLGPAPAATAAAEELVEDVLHPAHAAGAAERVAAAATAATAADAAVFLGLLEALVADLVVHLALLLVGEDLLGLLYLLELLLGVLLVGDVRMVLLCLLSIRVLDIVLAGVS